ncbi:MAG: right-handed parallel beta-helix repeat-containing protein [Pseudomonadota bacterium]
MDNNVLKPVFRFSKFILLTSFISSSAYAHAPVFQGPLVVNAAYVQANGSVISGNYQGTATQPAITITVSTPVTITNSLLQGPGDLIQATAVPANITVNNTTGTGTNPNVRGTAKGIFLHVNAFTNINMQNNIINGMRIGFYNSSYAGNRTASNTLIISKNIFNNVDARPSDGNNGYSTTGQYNGQAIHTGNITGLPGVDIGWNEIVNTAGQSSSGALIEFNETSGTSASPIQVHDNYISGALPTMPGKDLYAYGGILVNGGTNDTATTASAYINIVRNYVNATANFGIAIEAGNNNTVANNRVVSSGYLPDGKTFYPMSTYGNAAGAVNINLYNQTGTVFFNNSVTNNVLGLIKNNGSNQPVRNDWNLPGQGGAVSGNTSYLPNGSADPTNAEQAQEFTTWQTAASASSVIVGTVASVGYVSDGGALTATAPVNTGTSGNYVLDHVRITNPSGDCVNVAGGASITITNSVIGPCGGRGIHVASTAKAVIKNNSIHDVVSQGISSEFATSQSIQYNTITNSGFGIYLANNNANVTAATVQFNMITNVTGINGQNTSVIQFNQISGPNNSISCNYYVQPSPPPTPLQGPCDSFSLFLSSGTAASPLKMVGNRLTGSGDFWNCGGMMLTDGDTGPGTSGPGYVFAHDNLLVNAGNYGIDVSTGHDITIDGNYVYGDNNNFFNPSNNTFGPGRIGINTFNVYASSCTNITVTNNTVYFLSSLTGNDTTADYGLAAQCVPTNQSNNIGYTVGQSFTFPSITTPRPSCAALAQG